MIAGILLVIVAVLGGVGWFLASLHRPAVRTAPGWVYFLSSVGGAEDDPPAPIKIGMTHRNPATDRLPEIETMSPKPLELLYAFCCKQPALVERLVHEELAPYRRHGEWFDRDATMAYIDHVKGAA